MIPLAIFINIAGPIKNTDGDLCYQVELGIKPEDKEGESVAFQVVSESTMEALSAASDTMRGYVKKYYPKQAG